MSATTYEITEETIGKVTRLDDAPQWIYEIDNPYLHNVYAPTTDEIAADELEVIGELPEDLFGAYYRNGPNTVHKPTGLHHPFDGDGMIHAVYFRDGKASYRNSYIHTAGYMLEKEAGRAIWPGVMGTFDFSLPGFPIKDTCNTDVTLYAGQLMPTWYHSGVPYKMDPLTLENLGEYNLPGRTRRNMSAHNHVDWNTGEMLFMDYCDEEPFMTYGVGNPDGTLHMEIPIDLPGPRRPHDLGFTTNYTILHDLPLFHDANLLRRQGKMVLDFHRDIPARFGIIPRYGDSGDIRWFDCEPCFILHVSNCWEDGDWIVMDGCRASDPLREPAGGGELAHMLVYMRNETNNYRWRFNLKTGEVREGDIDDLNTEFNKTNQLFHGVQTKYAYHQRIPLLHEKCGHTLAFTALVKYNNETGEYDKWDYGEGVFGSEAPFAPVKGATRDNDEDDGYVITLVTDSNTWKSEALVFNARDITVGPIARVQIPHRVPAGFHGWWGRGEDLYV